MTIAGCFCLSSNWICQYIRAGCVDLSLSQVLANWHPQYPGFFYAQNSPQSALDHGISGWIPWVLLSLLLLLLLLMLAQSCVLSSQRIRYMPDKTGQHNSLPHHTIQRHIPITRPNNTCTKQCHQCQRYSMS